jgi:hypothetical protein
MTSHSLAFLEWGAVAVLAILGLLNLRDAARYHRFRNPVAVLLQFLGSVKSRIRACPSPAGAARRSLKPDWPAALPLTYFTAVLSCRKSCRARVA